MSSGFTYLLTLINFAAAVFTSVYTAIKLLQFYEYVNN